MKRGRPPRPEPPLPGQLDLFAITVPEDSQTAGPFQTATASKPAIPISPAPKPKAPKNAKARAAAKKPKKPQRLAGIAKRETTLLRVKDAAALLGLSKSTLDKMRHEGRGPVWVRLTGKIVAYDIDDLDAYLARRKTGGE
jgi:predicted DNA-binding transcriptional regulator AlpA